MDELMKELIKFQTERDWEQFHTPENLAKSISIEAAELLEHFQWNNEYNKEEVVDELADVINYCFLMADALDVDVKEIVFEDDTFTMKKARVMEICRLMTEKGLNKRFRWLCNARVNLDLETMKAMKAAGIHEYVKNAKIAGLQIHACYMVGNKGETKETMKETLRLALELKTDTAQFYPLLPFPGTEAYYWAKSNGYIHGGYTDYVKEDGTINCLLELPGITGDEMVKFCDDARKKYYLRPSYIWHRLVMGIKDPADFKRSLKAFKNIKKYLLKK